MASDTERRLTSLEATVEEFVRQTARLLGDHGSRLSRVEAQIESLVAVFQASDRRLNRIEAQIEALTEAALNHERRLDRLTTIVESNEPRFAQLTDSQARLIDSQERVLARMDDVIAVMRERL